ncbi:hypothetical protein UFOVP130_17 [uncultured Caudovirales phage]|uniref:Uncharacterized protein n=1 Tax=uncultured Caudovirales phage TaxID=2100421 RepID=A0A6J5L7V8_9CAUD|nr:hypothetical protein UFOVP130_17 [uncultured Caudovirales phage]
MTSVNAVNPAVIREFPSEAVVLAGERRELLEAALERLGDVDNVALKLQLRGYSPSQIADLLGVSRQRAQQISTRAQAALRRVLAEDGITKLSQIV